MSFSSLLSQIKHKTKGPEAKPSYTYNPNTQTKTNNKSSSSSTAASQKPVRSSSSSQSLSSYSEHPRVIDPAVQRLKELRRLENAKKEASQPKPKTQRRKSASSSTTGAASIRRRTPEVRIKESVMTERPRSSSPQKRLTFAELMKQAQDKTKTLKDPKSEEPVETPTSAGKYVSKTQPKVTQPKYSINRDQRLNSAAQDIRRPVQKTSTSSSSSTARPTGRHATAKSGSLKSAPTSSASKPQRPQRPVGYSTTKPKELAKPSAKLQAKLDAKRKREQERRERTRQENYDSYESDFVEDDEEDDVYEKDPGYDRDEIWKMFSRGRSRNDYIRDDEEDLSDMEATGDEVMKEEMRSAKRARMEELAEQERERKRQEEKRRRLGK